MIRYVLDTLGGEVLWVEPYPTRLPRISDLNRPAPLEPTDVNLPQGLQVLPVKALPVEPLPLGGALNGRLFWQGLLEKMAEFAGEGRFAIGVGKPSDLAIQAIDYLGPAWSFYDAMDNYPSFYRGLSRRSMAARERQIVSRVDEITVPSARFASRFNNGSLSISELPNGCDADALPGFQRVKPERRVFGYVGTIGRWFDWDCVERLAQAAPESEFRIIGPCHAPPRGRPPDNVSIEPELAHPEAIAQMSGFSAGLIPFVTNSLTEYVDPVKYYEYRAMGLPVLTTTFGTMRLRKGDPGLFFVDQDRKPSEILTFALQFEDSQSSVAKFRTEHAWTRRFSSARLLSRML